MIKFRNSTAIALLWAGFAALFGPSALAQSGTAAAQDIEEILVTATRREESIQDVPIAVSAFAGEDLDARGVQDLYGLQEVSPSISVYSSNSTSNGGTVRIRGVGTTGNNPGLEAAVGTFIDGVYRSRAGQAFSDFVDIDRVEVLRGPQGTLFGKNTSAGALQIITKKPEFEQSSMVALSAGDFGAIKVQASATGPLADDRLAYRLSVNYHERDGYYEDNVTDDAYDSRERYSIKGQLLWQGDTWDNRLILDYTDRDEDCCPANFHSVNFNEQGPSATTRGILNLGEAPGVIINDLLAANGRPAERGDDDESWDVGVNFDPFELVEDKGIQNQLNWNISDNLSLTSITSYREFDVERGQDIDFTGADVLQPQYTNESFENFSQELQLQFNTERGSYLVGAYFYTEDIATDEAIRLAEDGPEYVSRYVVGLAPFDLYTLTNAPFGTTTGAGLGTYNPATRMLEGDGTPRPNYQENDGYAADYAQETDGWSIFTHNTFDLTETLTLTVGARYSNETKDAITRINGVEPVQGTQRDLMAAMLRNEFNEAHCTGLVFIGSLCNIVSWEDKETEKEWTGTVSLSWAVTDEVNLYGTVSRGYKAGGFNLDQQAIEMDSFATFLATGGDARFLLESGLAADVPQAVEDGIIEMGSNGLTQFECGSLGGIANQNLVPNASVALLDCAFFDDDHRFEPEFVNAYEIGMKGQFLDGRLTTNVAVFYSDFEDFQLNTFTGTGFLISNTDEMISKGVEFEGSWILADGILWSLGITYADTRYGDDLNDPRTETELFLDQEFGLMEDWAALENIEGRQITHAPYWQGSTSLFAEQPLNDRLFAYGNLNVGFRGAHNTGSDLRRQKDVSDEVLVNLQLGLRAADDRWDFQVWARNLFDNHIETLVFNSVFQGGSYSTFLAPPRMVGATLRMNFQ